MNLLYRISNNLKILNALFNVLGLTKGIFVWMLQFFSKRMQNQNILNVKHRLIYHYIESNLYSKASKYNYTLDIVPIMKCNPGIHYVYFFWYQGRDAMPPIIQACYNQIVKVNKDNKNVRIILITKNNLNCIIKIPDYIYENLNAKNMSLAHFSDIVRFSLLYYYGGLWSDATVYHANAIRSEMLKRTYWTINTPTPRYTISVSMHKWSTYFISISKKKDAFAKDVLNCLLAYWKKETSIFDYFLLDYIIDYVCKNKIYGKEFLSVPLNNLNVYLILV